LAAETVEEIIDASRGYCFIYDSATGELSSVGEGRRWSAMIGLCGFAARTRSAVRVDHVGEDSRYYKEFDDAGGRGDERFLAVPILGRDGNVLALLVAMRDASGPCFCDKDREMLQKLAEQFAPYFIQLNLQTEVNRVLSRGASVVRERQLKIFREEALESLAAGPRNHGDLLRISPTWTKWTYWLLCLIFLTGAFYSFFGTIDEYAVGSAFVRVEGRSNLTAIWSGTVSSIEVQPGQAVVAGQLLVRFYDAQEAMQLDRINKELEFYLLESLRNPSNPASQQALTSLRAQKQVAQSQLEQRSVRAPRAGIVSDIRIRPGQLVSAGEALLSLVDKVTNPSMTAIIPGHYRPLLERGMLLRLELSGYQHAYQELAIESIGEEIVGPIEIRRHLGHNVADTVAITGPSVIIYAHLPSHTFVADGRQYDYYDGLQGKVEVRIRSERIIFHLIPALRSLFGRADG
jgi:membrane fusion protein (multidrug efflux system)